MVTCLYTCAGTASLINVNTEKLCKMEKLFKADKQNATQVDLERSFRNTDGKCSCAQGHGNDHFHCPQCDVIIIHRHNIGRHLRTKHGAEAVRKDGKCVCVNCCGRVRCCVVNSDDNM